MKQCQNGAGMERKRCLILAGDGATGDQLALLLKECGGYSDIVHSDQEAYGYLLENTIDVLIADIDTENLGGLAVLAYCHHQYPAITTYAITPSDDGYRKKLARDLCGCRGFIYLMAGSPNIDIHRGMASELTSRWLEPA